MLWKIYHRQIIIFAFILITVIQTRPPDAPPMTSESILNTLLPITTDDHFHHRYDIARDIFAVKLVLILLYTLIGIVGLIGNLLVICIVVRTKHMRTITNIFITNLAISDVLMSVVTLPFTPISLYDDSQGAVSEAACKILPITMGILVYVSTLTSMAISLDRYFAIGHPFLPRMKIWLCIVIIIVIWVIAILIPMPLAVFQQPNYDSINRRWSCLENWPKDSSKEVFTIVGFVLQFFLPCSIISVCYFRIGIILRNRLKMKMNSHTNNTSMRLRDENEIRRKRRTNSILIAMVVIFVICWIPHNILLIYIDLVSEDKSSNMQSSPYFTLIFLLCHLIAMSSAVYNPFLYAWMNENFRKVVCRHILPFCCSSQSVRPPVGQSCPTTTVIQRCANSTCDVEQNNTFIQCVEIRQDLSLDVNSLTEEAGNI